MNTNRHLTQTRIKGPLDTSLRAQQFKQQVTQPALPDKLQTVAQRQTFRVPSNQLAQRSKEQQVAILEQLLAKARQAESAKANAQQLSPQQSVSKKSFKSSQLVEEIQALKQKQQEVEEKYRKAEYIYKELGQFKLKQAELDKLKEICTNLNSRSRDYEEQIAHKQKQKAKLQEQESRLSQKLEDLRYKRQRVIDAETKNGQYRELNASAEQLVQIKEEEIIRLGTQIDSFQQLMDIDFVDLMMQLDEEDQNSELKLELAEKLEEREQLRKENDQLLKKIERFFRDVE